MAKTSKINKQLQREQIVAKYAQRRAQCKRDSVNPHLTADERAEQCADCMRSPATPARPGCATATASTADRAPSTVNSDCPVST